MRATPTCASIAAFVLMLTATSHAVQRDRPDDGAVVVAWNERAYDLAFATDSFRTFRGQHALATMHLSMHDAVNAVT